MIITPAVMSNIIQSPFRVVNFWTAFFLPFPSEKVFMEANSELTNAHPPRVNGNKGSTVFDRTALADGGEIPLKVEPDLSCQSTRCDVVRAAKR